MNCSAVPPTDPDEFDVVLFAYGVRAPLDRTVQRPVVPVRAMVRAYAELIGDDDEMIAASYGFQSIVSGLAGPSLTGAVVLGCAPRFMLADVRWGIGPYGPVVGVGQPHLAPAGPGQALDDLLDVIVDLAASMRAEVRIARRLLMGNAAAALLAVLRRVEAQDGVDEQTCVALAQRTIDALGRPAVAALVELDGWTTFQRRTCCLLRFAGARGVCQECSLLDQPGFRDEQLAVRRSLGR